MSKSNPSASFIIRNGSVLSFAVGFVLSVCLIPFWDAKGHEINFFPLLFIFWGIFYGGTFVALYCLLSVNSCKRLRFTGLIFIGASVLSVIAVTGGAINPVYSLLLFKYFTVLAVILFMLYKKINGIGAIAGLAVISALILNMAGRARHSSYPSWFAVIIFMSAGACASLIYVMIKDPATLTLKKIAAFVGWVVSGAVVLINLHGLL